MNKNKSPQFRDGIVSKTLRITDEREYVEVDKKFYSYHKEEIEQILENHSKVRSSQES